MVAGFVGPVVLSSDSGVEPDDRYNGTFMVKFFGLSFPCKISGAVRHRYSVLDFLTFFSLGGQYLTKLSPMYETAGRRSTDFDDDWWLPLLS